MTKETQVRVIPLKEAPGKQEAWSKPAIVILLWMIVELVIVTNPFQFSSSIRAAALRLFGAQVGKGVILRPRIRVKFPWNLTIGENCWIGEGVWIHNQNKVVIGNDVCISQETFITTGTHAFRTDMALITKAVHIEDGVWVCSRAIILAGVTLGTSSVVPAGMTVPHSVESGTIHGAEGRTKRFNSRN